MERQIFMDIKEFIKETIAGIVDATVELQEEYQDADVIINPPVSVKERDLFKEGGTSHTYRRVETIEFDVAVTASSETGGGGKAGLRILSVEAGIDGKHVSSAQEASRVRFSIPITLRPSGAEAINKAASEKQNQAIKEKRKQMNARRSRGGNWSL
ncbi:MAG: hypothetical protein AB3N21_13010 [Ruegeria sp.]|uniref:hypothetical protein n=1 Tax=Ruegeria sp. TaxID=1879320 RepID=UPI00349E7E1A